MADNKKVYNFNGVQKIEEGKFIGAIEGWVLDTEKNRPSVRTVSVNGEDKKVFNFTISSGIASSKMKFLGLPEGDTLWLSVSAWERLAERLEKLNLRKGHQVLLFGTIVVKESDKGTKYAQMMLNDFKVTKYPKNEDGSALTQQVEDDLTPSEEYGDMPF